jgi:hypothetical protein
MPWCEECDRFYTPSTLSTGGDCPEGHHVADAPDAGGLAQSDAGDGESGEQKFRVPWHFWLLVAVLVVYLGYRLIQLISWLLG